MSFFTKVPSPTSPCQLCASTTFLSHTRQTAHQFSSFSTLNDTWMKTTEHKGWFGVSSAARQTTLTVLRLQHQMQEKQVMQVGHTKCILKTSPQFRHLQRKKYVTADSISVCCYGLPRNKGCQWGLKNLLHQLCLHITCPCSIWKCPTGTHPS